MVQSLLALLIIADDDSHGCTYASAFRDTKRWEASVWSAPRKEKFPLLRPKPIGVDIVMNGWRQQPSVFKLDKHVRL